MWIDALRLAYPREWESVLLASHCHPPISCASTGASISAISAGLRR